MKLISYIIILVIVVFGTMFAMLNSKTVDFNYYFGNVTVALSLLLAISLFLGVLLGGGIGFIRVITLRLKIRRLRRKLKNAEQEVKNLRDIPIKDKN
ncbi:MAG: lipopolysaccharide assembly protein LapA domain-containing protein [Pseudomonadota bacterium]